MLAHLAVEFQAVGLEPQADVFQRQDNLVLEPLDAQAERTRDVFDAAGQRRVDVLRKSRQGLGQFGGALLQCFSDFGRLGVHALREFASAFAEGASRVQRIARQRLRQRAATLAKTVLDAREQGVEHSQDTG